MRAAALGHFNVVQYLVTHYGDTIDINVKNDDVSIVMYYIFCVDVYMCMWCDIGTIYV